MLGRIGCVFPHVISRRPGSWFGMFVCIERITQMSSMHFPTSGYIALTSMPDCPHFLNANGDLMNAPVLRSVLYPEPAGGVLPCCLVSSGLGSNVSTWLGAPFMNRWMTCLAL